MGVVTDKQLIESLDHFSHQTTHWLAGLSHKHPVGTGQDPFLPHLLRACMMV